MNNQTEAYNRLTDAADQLQEARDKILQARLAFDLGMGYQGHKIAVDACQSMACVLEIVKYVSIIGETMARKKQTAAES